MRISRTLTAFAAAAAVLALVGCSSTSGSTSSDSSSARPEDERTTAAAVATGLTAIKDLTAQIAQAPAAQGQTLSEGIEPLWAPIEGTVQANSQDTYDALEGAFTKLESGDASQAAEGARDAAAAIDAYLADYPG